MTLLSATIAASPTWVIRRKRLERPLRNQAVILATLVVLSQINLVSCCSPIFAAAIQDDGANQAQATLPRIVQTFGQDRANRRLSRSKINRTIRVLTPLAKKIPEPKPGEWLDVNKEPGQSFSQYLRSRPVILNRQRKVLYVQPIGEFNDSRTRLVKLSAEYLAIYFNCEVRILVTQPDTTIPDEAKRTQPQSGATQLLTTYILETKLAPELPTDAFATIAFTSADLWPGDGWNFVFGYAAYRERVGVWSLARLGNPDDGEEAFRQTLLRTIKIATHETGHMFSIKHCTAHQCNMQGSNSLAESDSQPLSLCPQCHAKILHAVGVDPIKRYGELIEFCEQHGLSGPLANYRAAMAELAK